MSKTTYKTESGSIYVVDHQTNEICKGLTGGSVGSPLYIYWGDGIDSFSPSHAEAESNNRYTVTSRVVEETNDGV